MVYVRRRVWLLCASAAAASLLVLRPFQAAEEPAASSLPDVEALRNPCSSKMTRRAPEAFRACFGTSHGPFEAHCVRRRAPVWVDRVYNLLVNGFYDDQRGRMLSVPRSHERTSGIHVGRWQPLGSGPLSSRSRPDSCAHTSHSPSTPQLHLGSEAVASRVRSLYGPLPAQSRPPPWSPIPRRAPPSQVLPARAQWQRALRRAVWHLRQPHRLERRTRPNPNPSPAASNTSPALPLILSLTPTLAPTLAVSLALAPDQAPPPYRTRTTTARADRAVPSCSRSRTACRTAPRRGRARACTG